MSLLEDEEKMLKIVVFDTRFGGEIFADKLTEVLGIVDVVRVIDWRNAEKAQCNKRFARRTAEEALRPYIGKVDLIVLTNYFLSLTSLKYFRRKYKHQKFVGIKFKYPESFVDRKAVILTTTGVKRTITFFNFVRRLKRETVVLEMNDWPRKIDDGSLTMKDIFCAVYDNRLVKEMRPNEVYILCSEFMDITNELREAFGHNIKIYSDFDDLVRRICKALKIRGGLL